MTPAATKRYLLLCSEQGYRRKRKWQREKEARERQRQREREGGREREEREQAQQRPAAPNAISLISSAELMSSVAPKGDAVAKCR